MVYVNQFRRCNCSRIRDVNKLQLEGLTKAGAFDEFDEEKQDL